MEVVVTTGAISRAKIQSNHHHQQTNTQLFYRLDVLPVAKPICQSTEGKYSVKTNFLSPCSFLKGMVLVLVTQVLNNTLFIQSRKCHTSDYVGSSCTRD